jgi:hypothetical protein
MRTDRSAGELRNLARHFVHLAIRCDLIDKQTRRRLAVTLLRPRSDGFLACLLVVKPHSAAGRQVCARFQVGEVMLFDLGRRSFSARVATKGPDGLWIYAADILYRLIMPAYIPERISRQKLWRPRRG